jgi:hypothetical protein
MEANRPAKGATLEDARRFLRRDMWLCAATQIRRAFTSCCDYVSCRQALNRNALECPILRIRSRAEA